MSFFGEKPDFDLSLSSTLKRNWTVVAARGVLGLVIGLIAFLSRVRRCCRSSACSRSF
jgi:uncharacterized membrane protein HdeD (DUF308 family)